MGMHADWRLMIGRSGWITVTDDPELAKCMIFKQFASFSLIDPVVGAIAPGHRVSIPYVSTAVLGAYCGVKFGIDLPWVSLGALLLRRFAGLAELLEFFYAGPTHIPLVSPLSPRGSAVNAGVNEESPRTRRDSPRAFVRGYPFTGALMRYTSRSRGPS